MGMSLVHLEDGGDGGVGAFGFGAGHLDGEVPILVGHGDAFVVGVEKVEDGLARWGGRFHLCWGWRLRCRKISQGGGRW